MKYSLLLVLALTVLWPQSGAAEVCAGLSENEEYHQLVAEGTQRIRQEDYDGAMDFFKKAQEICPYDPAITYLMARAKHLAGECEVAQILYDQAIAQIKSGQVLAQISVDAIEIKRSEACVDANAQSDPEPTPAPLLAEEANTSEADWELPTGPVISLSVGSVLVLSSVVLYAMTDSLRSELDELGDPVAESTMTQSEAYDQRDQANDLAMGGNILLGLGAATLAGGAIWWLLDDSAEVNAMATHEGLYGSYTLRW